ncbi:hypothetical protein CL615_03770 [archaeon]|jgi:hypothetical protein|nr:hypothetical protein [archaeon]MDP6547932.1 hypothetical protein [Candidatus Woesearchaeota archaeon]|tara:strand:+ start:112256 stop:113893 length:1638 start_codon:yes stop_codon:yes gene_type:complete
MKKRAVFFLIYILFLAALVPNAFSIYELLVYSGTVEDGDEIVIANKTFEFKIDSRSNRAYIEIDVSAAIVESGECQIKDGFDICIKNVSFSYRNYTIWYDVYKALVEVYQIKSNLDATNTIEQDNLLIGEETTAELAIENTADIVAEDVTALTVIPSYFLVKDVDGCKKTSDGILFEGNVHPRQIRKCTYKLQALNPGDFKLTSNLTYFDSIEKKSLTSNTINGKIYNYSLKISSKLDKSKSDILEKINLTINIENTNEEHDLDVQTLTIKIPEKLLLLKFPKDTSGNERIISWRGSLSPGENKSFVLEFKSSVTGNYSVPTEVNYKVDTFPREAKKISEVEVSCVCPYIEHQFSKEIYSPKQKTSLKAYLFNPIEAHSFSNVRVSYITNVPNLQDFSKVYSIIHPGQNINIFDSSIIAPELGEEYYLNITSLYKSSGDQVFTVKDNIAIKVSDEEETEPEEKIEMEEEQSEEQKEETQLDAGKLENATEDSIAKEEPSENIPVTTLNTEEKKLNSYLIVTIIAVIILFIFLIIKIKRRKSEVVS